VPDQRALLLGRLASAIDGVADVAQHLGPPGTQAKAPAPSPPPLASVGRPWTLAAAKEPIATAVVERTAPVRGASQATGMPSEPPHPLEHHRSWVPLAAIGSTLIVLVVIAAVGLHLLTGGGGAHPRAPSTAQILLTGVRPLASAPAAGSAPATQVSFPAKTSVVDIEVNSGGQAGQAPVEIVVSVGQPAQAIIQNAYVLSQSGATVIPLASPGGAFAPGEYTVTITYKGALLGATAFAVH
jgi:hypothetical protein